VRRYIWQYAWSLAGFVLLYGMMYAAFGVPIAVLVIIFLIARTFIMGGQRSQTSVLASYAKGFYCEPGFAELPRTYRTYLKLTLRFGCPVSNRPRS
jgi:hypothetical protein